MTPNIRQNLMAQYKRQLGQNAFMTALFVGILVWSITMQRNFNNPLWQEIMLGLSAFVSAMILRIICYKFLPPHRHRLIIFCQLPLLLVILGVITVFTPMQGGHIPMMTISCIYVTEPLWTLCLAMSDLGMVRAGTYLTMNAKVIETHKARYKTLQNLTTGDCLVFNKVELADDTTYRIHYYPHCKILVFDQIPDVQEMTDAEEAQEHPLDDIDESAYRTDTPPIDDPQPTLKKTTKRLLTAIFVLLDAIAGVLGFVLKSSFWYALFPLIFGQIFMFSTLQAKEKRARCTRRMEGHVVDVVVSRSSKHRTYYPVIEYRVHGKTYRMEGNVGGPPDIVGELVSIRFNPDNPEEAVMDNKMVDSMGLVIAIIATVVGVGMILFNLYDMFNIS